MKPCIIALLVVLLAACSASRPEPPLPIFQPPVATPEALHRTLASLPGAEALEGEVGIRYPGEVLFAAGTVLPLPGGLKLLDPLAEVLFAHPSNSWTLRVRADTEHGRDYDLELAEGRATLLQRFLTRRGVAAERLEWQVEAEAGAPLDVRPRP